MIANQFLNIQLKKSSKNNIDESIDRDSVEVPVDTKPTDDPLLNIPANPETSFNYRSRKTK
jgi:hypothetical protein